MSDDCAEASIRRQSLGMIRVLMSELFVEVSKIGLTWTVRCLWIFGMTLF